MTQSPSVVFIRIWQNCWYGKFGWRGRPWPREREGPAPQEWEG